MKIQGKIAIVTGGASGLGLAVAQYLIKEKGAKVALLDLNVDSGNAAVMEFGGENALFCNTDVADERSVAEAITCVVDTFGKIDIVINAAATPYSFKILDRDGRASGFDKFTSVIRTNLIGTFNVMGQCIEKMVANNPENGERGVIINTSSISAFEGQIGTSAYSASKAGINGMNMPAARELGGVGIRVNSIAPGLFNTPMSSQLNQEVKQALLNICEAPKRMGNPDEYAHACAFIIENSYMNGRVLRLDAASIMCA